MKVGDMTRVRVALVAAALLATPTLSAAKTVMVIGPHPDDEAIIGAGRTRAGVDANDIVKVVVVTNGDFNGQAVGYQREPESVNAALALGLGEQDVIFLGYPDGNLVELWAATSGDTIFTSFAGLTATYGNRGLGGADYHYYRSQLLSGHGVHAPYSRNGILSDFIDLFTQFAPDEVYATLGPNTTHTDLHGDHTSVGLFVLEALAAMHGQAGGHPVRAYFTIVWDSSGQWPDDLGLGYTPLRPYTAPDQVTPAEWAARTDFAVPPEMQVVDPDANFKVRALCAYESQGGCTTDWMLSHVRPTEFFWQIDPCADGACGPQPDGATCALDTQCANNHCVDGYCCNSSCDGQCQACDVADHLGACTAVSGVPHGTRTACTTDGSACGGRCNGSTTNACTYPGNLVSCRTASCASGTATLAATCNGSGTCPLHTQACNPYVCGPTACLTSCTLDSQCTSGDHCNAGVCTTGKDDGAACTAGSQCSSGSCVDGYCCNSSCSGQCQACDVAGHLGACWPVNGAPHGTRTTCTSDGSACGGSCNGVVTNNCTYPGNLVSCRAASCTSGTATLAATCNGSGACPLQTQSCSPYVCGATACLGGCNGDEDCVAGQFCAGGVCTPKKDNSATCGADRECTSDKCVDGRCCNSSCSGQCQACDVAGHLGACWPVGGSPHGTRTACATDGTVCGGSCNGFTTATCTYPDDHVSCRSASCTSGTVTLAAACNNKGACPKVQTQSCSPYACGATACLGDCNGDEDCVAGQFCAGGVCTPKKDNGVACGGNNQCTSDTCADGYCCDAACGGQCQACDVAGHLGTCWPVTGAPHGARTACLTDGSACGGSCNGSATDGCTYPDDRVSCRTASCTSGTATLAAGCNSRGACPNVQTQPCSPYVCGATACLGDCSGDEDCVAGQFCAGGVCTPKKDDGASCAGNNQCAHDSCVDGYCCNSACGGQCQACDVEGHHGTCTPVIGDPHGVRTACGTNEAGCAGACDGGTEAACTYPSTCAHEPSGGGGGGGCASGGEAGAWSLALLGLLLPRLRRRRRHAVG
jgi:MYXO-CTERM domain-containing protein